MATWNLACSAAGFARIRKLSVDRVGHPSRLLEALILCRCETRPFCLGLCFNVESTTTLTKTAINQHGVEDAIVVGKGGDIHVRFVLDPHELRGWAGPDGKDSICAQPMLPKHATMSEASGVEICTPKSAMACVAVLLFHLLLWGLCQTEWLLTRSLKKQCILCPK